MTFRKNATLFYQITIYCIFIAIAGLLLFVFVRLWLLPVCSAVMALVAWSNFRSFDEFITMNEDGVTCEKAGKQLWGYDWESIAELRKGTHFRTKAIYIIGYDKFGKPEPYPQLDRYFLLGKAAKEALKRYYAPKD